MCAECKCNGNQIGKINDKLTGKPDKPGGGYEGVGGSK